MKQRYLSIFLSITLMASVITGALSVSVSTVKADDPSGYTLYWEDFKDEMLQLALPTSYLSSMIAVLNEVDSYWDNPNFNIWIMRDPDGNLSLVGMLRTNGTGIYGSGWTNPQEYQLTSGSYPSYYSVKASFCYYNGNFRWCGTYNQSFIPSARRSIIDLGTQGTYANFYCSPFEFNASGWKCYSLRSMNSGNANGYTMPANIVEGSAPPDYLEYNVVTFYLGERLYFTFKEQDIFREIEPDHLDYTLVVEHDSLEDPILYTWDNVTLLPNAQNFLDIGLSDVSPAGVYAIDITNSGWIVIDLALLLEFDADLNAETMGYAVNAPYRIGNENPEPGTNGTPDSYTEVWNNWNTYITNYPNSPIVAQDLVPQFYNTQAASCRPCEVAIPSSLWNEVSDFTVSGQDIFEYHFPLVNAPIYNYELFDVCVLSRQELVTGDLLGWDYTLKWWYSDSSNPKSTVIQDLNFNVLMEMFDILIVVDDPDNVLMGNIGDIVYTGDYEYGFTYSQSAFIYPGVLYGFAFVTEKAVQKQLLFNFNDGIRKSYDLMEQYIDHRQAWDNSFLEWTTTLFTQYQTLYGKLDDIYSILFTWDGLLKNISNKLDQIAENTSEDDPGYWFISFYNWVKRWEPSNSDFANWVDSWDDYTDSLPDPGSGVTVIPFPTSIPTAVVAGG